MFDADPRGPQWVRRDAAAVRPPVQPRQPRLHVAGDLTSTSFGRIDTERADGVESPDALVLPTVGVATTSSSPRRKVWLKRYLAVLVLSDFVTSSLAATLALVLRFSGSLALGPNLAVALALPVAWIVLIALSRGYEGRAVGVGSEEFRRLGRAFLYLSAGVSVTSYITRTQLARGFILVALPLALILGLIGRYLARKRLHEQRAAGKAMTTVLLVGDARSIEEFTTLVDRDKYTGMQVVGACLPDDLIDDPSTLATLASVGVPLLGDVDSVLAAAELSKADTVAVVSSSSIGTEKLRWISWQLEGRTTDLVVAPGLVEVAGTRLHIQPVAGLPLLHVDEPTFTGFARVMKAGIDRLVSALALLFLAPMLLFVALAIRLDSRGPAFFRQTRVGINGETFTMVKFRSMFIDAEERLAHLKGENDHGGDHVLFKMKNDPRVTRVGRFLRKTSLDELPQLLNVLAGSMSLVGPRPPLPSEVARYEEHVHRRLLVKPGLTGLWQVSGRSDLAWDESVRLDLRYVENWSIAGDLMILWKTMFAVLRREGAY